MGPCATLSCLSLCLQSSASNCAIFCWKPKAGLDELDLIQAGHSYKTNFPRNNGMLHVHASSAPLTYNICVAKQLCLETYQGIPLSGQSKCRIIVCKLSSFPEVFNWLVTIWSVGGDSKPPSETLQVLFWFQAAPTDAVGNSGCSPIFEKPKFVSFLDKAGSSKGIVLIWNLDFF